MADPKIARPCGALKPYRERMQVSRTVDTTPVDLAAARSDPDPVLSPSTATTGQRALGIGMMLTGSVGNQFGAAFGAIAFPEIGPVGVVAIRQIVTAAVLFPVARPGFHRYGRAE